MLDCERRAATRNTGSLPTAGFAQKGAIGIIGVKNIFDLITERDIGSMGV